MEDKTKEKKKVKKLKDSKESKSKPNTPKVKKIATPPSTAKKTPRDGTKSAPITPKKPPATPKKVATTPSTPKTARKETTTTPKKVKKDLPTPSKTPKLPKKGPPSHPLPHPLPPPTNHKDTPLSHVPIIDLAIAQEPSVDVLEEVVVIEEPTIETDVPIQASDLSTGVTDLTENIRIRLARLLDECQDNVALLLDLHKDICDYLKMKGIVQDIPPTITTTTAAAATTTTTTSDNNNQIIDDTKDSVKPTEKGDTNSQNNPVTEGAYPLGSVSVSVSISSSTDATELLRGMSAEEKAALRAKALQRIRKIKERMVTPDGERAATPDPLDPK